MDKKLLYLTIIIEGSIKKIKDFRRKIKFVKGDIRNENDLKKAANGANVIIHLAYINGTKFFYSKPELVLEVAVEDLKCI